MTCQISLLPPPNLTGVSLLLFRLHFQPLSRCNPLPEKDAEPPEQKEAQKEAIPTAEAGRESAAPGTRHSTSKVANAALKRARTWHRGLSPLVEGVKGQERVIVRSSSSREEKKKMKKRHGVVVLDQNGALLPLFSSPTPCGPMP